MTHLSLAFLGTFHVTLDDEPVTTFKSDKVRALLAYLAVEADRPHRRDVLAGLLWPEWSNQDARSNLRYALYNLRTVIRDHTATHPFLLVTRDTIQFNATSDHNLDVADLQQHLAASRRHMADESDLSLAVQLYCGAFLEGFSVKDSPAFEEWALFKREQIARQVADALHLLASIYERRGEYAQAQGHVRRQLELELWDEQAHRHLMRMLALDGQRNAALTQYETCRRLLNDELSIEPERETTALSESIRDGMLSGQEKRAVLIAPSLIEAEKSVFVGRERELIRLDGFLDAVLARQGQVAFVVGDAGTGKTVLVNKFTRRAMEKHGDVVVAHGNCNAHTGIGDPYLPFREILQMLTGDVEAKRASGAIGYESARRLWRVLPDAVQTLVDAGPGLIDILVPGAALVLRTEAFAPAGSAWKERLEEIVKRKALQQSSDKLDTTPKQMDLFEQVTKVLLALARWHPLILVLDDLQWADIGSISLLFHLGRRLAGTRILIVGAYRPGDVALGQDGARHPLEPIVHELQRDLGDIQIDLAQVDDRGFVDALIDVEPNRLNAAFRETFYQHTGGNPLFAVELLQGLRERKDLVQDQAGQWIEGATLNWEQLPARVEAVIAERLGRLSLEWQAALAVASVEGETFTAEVVARVQGLEEVETIRHLSDVFGKQHRLVRASSLRRLGTLRLSRYRFRHILFQKYLYNRLDDVERAHLHEAVGNTLETMYAENRAEAVDMATVAGQLAWHFEVAGMVDKAVDYLFQAGERAVQMSANEEALVHYTRGLELLETLPGSPERAQHELSFQLALGVPLRAIKSYGTPERGRVYDRAHQLSQQIGEPSQIFQTLLMQWSYCMPRAEHRKALGMAKQALDLARQIEDPVQTAAAHTALGMNLVYLGEFTQARINFELALADYDPRQRQSLISLIGQDIKVTCLAYLSWVLWFLGYPDQALQRTDEAIALARDLGQPFGLGFALGIAGCVVHLRCGKYDVALEEAETLLELWAEHGFALYQAWGKCVKGRALTELGRTEEGLSTLREGVVACKSVGILASHTQQLANFAKACASAGQIEEGLSVIAEALALVEEADERHFEADLSLRKGELLMVKGRAHWVEAQDCLYQAIEVARRQSAKSWELRAVTILCRLWREQDKHKEARQLLAKTLGWLTEGFDTIDLQQAKALLEELVQD
ncbi:MAG: AAA family ATPase [Chloroflexi bacterium]|nr:AAA family ATPase [Chloroflexota bacterium]